MGDISELEQNAPRHVPANFSSGKLLQYLESAPIGIIMFSSNFKVEFINENFYRFDLLKEITNLTGRNLLETSLVSELLITSELESVTKGFSFEKQVRSTRTINGNEISLILKCSPIFIDDVFDGGVLIIEDVKVVENVSKSPQPGTSTSEDQKSISEEEAAEVRQFQNIASALTDALISTDLSGKVTFWNKAAENLFNYSRSQVYGKFIGKAVKYFTRQIFDSIKSEVVKGSIWENELKLSTEDDQEEFIEVRVVKTGDQLVVLCSSISERMNIERELRISEERFRNIVIHANELICNVDLDGNIIFTNPHFINKFEYTEGELLQKNFRELIDVDSEYIKYGSFSEFVSYNSGSTELTFISKSGNKFYTLANFSPILNLDNTPKYFTGLFTDITDKKEAEKDLLMIRSVYEASKDGIAVSVDKKFIMVNESFARMFYFNNIADVTGRDSLDIIAEKDISKVSEYFEKREKGLDAPNHFEFLGKRKNGSVFHVDASFTSYKAQGKIYIVCVCRDITERKRVQQAIKDSEERYRSITENINDSLWTAELINGKIRPVFYTATIKKITGYKQEQFIADTKLWLKIIHPDDSLIVKKKLRLLFSDKARSSDEVDFRIIDKSGNIVWVRNKLTIKRDDEENVVKIFGLVSDISMSKKAEEDLKRSAEGLKELNATKDKFISIISHDLRTPFSSILGFTDILLSEKDMSDIQRNQYISFIQESSNNMLTLVNSLLDWTRLQTGRIKFEPERLNVGFVVEKAFSIMRGAALQKEITLENEVIKNVFVYADSNLLIQAFNNLISNAIKFTGTKGRIIISAAPNDKLNQIEFIVKDTGIGIKKENINKLFKVDSKFTTNGTAGERGSGLGLSLVHDIIEKHGGKVWVESEYGYGTEFHFTIPVAAANILLVDDNKTDRLLYSKILKKVIPNYSVDISDNGEEAFQLILKSAPALVITDHHMPVMSGYDLVKKIISSGITGKPPIIVLSADITKNISEEYRELGIEYIFQKPVNLSIFKEAVEKSLRKALYT